MKIFINSLVSKSLKVACNFFNQYHFLGMLIISLFFGGLLFYFSFLRSGENSISPVTMYCLENKDTKVCSRRYLGGKRLQDREIKEIIFTRCACRDLQLSNIKVSDTDFRGNNFSRAFFKNVSFLNVNLFKSSFYGAILNDVVFQDSDLRGVIFNFVTFHNVYFKNIDLRSSLLIGARFKNSYYDKNTKLPFSKEEAAQVGLLIKND